MSAPATPSWATDGYRVEGGGYFKRELPFGPWLFDGTRNAVRLHQYFGARVEPNVPADRFNPWTNGKPGVSLTLSHASADECREAAAALLEAVALIEGTDEGPDDEQQQRLHVTRDECIQREIVEPLGEYAADHDIEGIAVEVVETVGTGQQLRFRVAVAPLDFWEVVRRHAVA